MLAIWAGYNIRFLVPDDAANVTDEEGEMNFKCTTCYLRSDMGDAVGAEIVRLLNSKSREVDPHHHASD